jgi:ferredoxin
MRIHIDQGRCQGHGRCYAIAPDLIEPDDVGNGRELGGGNVPPEFEHLARKAADNCPEQAVILEDVPS